MAISFAVRMMVRAVLTSVLVAQLAIAAEAKSDSTYATARSGLHTAVDDYQRTVFEGGLVGVATGAAVGALAGVMSGNRSDIGRGAILGAVLGGVLGVIDGVNVAEKKKAYVRAENGLDATISKVRAQNGKLSKVVRSADSLVAIRRRQLDVLRQDAAGSDLRRSELKREISIDTEELDRAAADARKSRDSVRALVEQYRNTPSASSLQREVNANTAATDRLSQDQATLKSMGAGL
ncbi:MAG: hypothetical protein P4L98_23520 [Ancalomicrobiaceae bacterium]|nr:hypothetical protein [Ancalomicrobiaceae bacterium]